MHLVGSICLEQIWFSSKEYWFWYTLWN